MINMAGGHSAKKEYLPTDAPSFQVFRNVNDLQIADNDVSLEIRVLETGERVIFWDVILEHFPTAHIVMNGNITVTPMRRNLVE